MSASLSPVIEFLSARNVVSNWVMISGNEVVLTFCNGTRRKMCFLDFGDELLFEANICVT